MRSAGTVYKMTNAFVVAALGDDLTENEHSEATKSYSRGKAMEKDNTLAEVLIHTHTANILYYAPHTSPEGRQSTPGHVIPRHLTYT